MEITIKDPTSTLTFIIAKDVLKVIPYFDSMLSFEADDKVVMEVPNAYAIYSLIQSSNIPLWLSELEKIRCQDFLGLDPIVPKDLIIPTKAFDLLLEIAALVGYSDNIIDLLRKNFPQEYDPGLLPLELIHKIILRSISYRIFSADHDGKIFEWDFESGTIIKKFEGNGRPIRIIVCSPDNKYIIGGDHGNHIIVWDIATTKIIRNFRAHCSSVRCIVYSPDGQYFASSSDDGRIIIWDTVKTYDIIINDKDIKIHMLKGDNSYVSCIIYSPDGLYIVSVSSDDNIKIWDTRSAILVKTVIMNTRIHCIKYSPNAEYLIAGTEEGCIKILDAKTYQLLKTFGNHQDNVYDLACTQNNQYIVSCSHDRTIKIWNTLDHTLVHILEGHLQRIDTVVLSSDDKYVISGSDDKSIKIWDTNDGTIIRTLKGHEGFVNSVKVIEYENYLVKKLKKYIS